MRVRVTLIWPSDRGPFPFYSLTNAVLLERSYFERARPTLRKEDLEITPDTSRILRSVSSEQYRNTSSPRQLLQSNAKPSEIRRRIGDDARSEMPRISQSETRIGLLLPVDLFRAFDRHATIRESREFSESARSTTDFERSYRRSCPSLFIIPVDSIA